MQCFVRKFYSLCIIVFYVTQKKQKQNEMFFKFTTATVGFHFLLIVLKSRKTNRSSLFWGDIGVKSWIFLLQKLSWYCVQLTSDELRTFLLEKSHSDGTCQNFPLHSLGRKTGHWHLCMSSHFIRTTKTVRRMIMKDSGYNHADRHRSKKSWNIENPLCPWMNI